MCFSSEWETPIAVTDIVVTRLIYSRRPVRTKWICIVQSPFSRYIIILSALLIKMFGMSNTTCNLNFPITWNPLYSGLF